MNYPAGRNCVYNTFASENSLQQHKKGTCLGSMLENILHKCCTVRCALTVLCIVGNIITDDCLYNILLYYGLLCCISSACMCSGIEVCEIEHRKNTPIEHMIHCLKLLFHHGSIHMKYFDTLLTDRAIESFHIENCQLHSSSPLVETRTIPELLCWRYAML